MSGSNNKIVSTGRGGSGNFQKKKDLDPTMVPSEVPTLKGDVVSSGRGGAGNLFKNDDPERTRKAQDIKP